MTAVARLIHHNSQRQAEKVIIRINLCGSKPHHVGKGYVALTVTITASGGSHHTGETEYNMAILTASSDSSNDDRQSE